MNLREKFSVFMLGEAVAADLLSITRQGLEKVKSLPRYQKFNDLKKSTKLIPALRQIFSSQQISSQLNMENISCPYYQKPLGFLEMVENPNDCVARATLTAGLLQDENINLKFGEVLSDWFADLLLKQPDPALDVLEEAIYYEIPHAVIVINGIQFDPIASILPPRTKVEHKIQEMDLFKGLLGMCAVNFANSQPFDTVEKVDFLKEIHSINPESPTVARNLGGTLILLDKPMPPNLLATFSRQDSLDSYLTQAMFDPPSKNKILQKIKTRYGKNIFAFIRANKNFDIIFQNIYGGYDGL